MPSEKAQYIHRIGRTGRAGKAGGGFLLLTEEEARIWHCTATRCTAPLVFTPSTPPSSTHPSMHTHLLLTDEEARIHTTMHTSIHTSLRTSIAHRHALHPFTPHSHTVHTPPFAPLHSHPSTTVHTPNLKCPTLPQSCFLKLVSDLPIARRPPALASVGKAEATALVQRVRVAMGGLPHQTKSASYQAWQSRRVVE